MYVNCIYCFEWMNYKNLYIAMVRNAEALSGKNVSHDAVKKVSFQSLFTSCPSWRHCLFFWYPCIVISMVAEMTCCCCRFCTTVTPVVRWRRRYSSVLRTTSGWSTWLTTRFTLALEVRSRFSTDSRWKAAPGTEPNEAVFGSRGVSAEWCVCGLCWSVCCICV